MSIKGITAPQSSTVATRGCCTCLHHLNLLFGFIWEKKKIAA